MKVLFNGFWSGFRERTNAVNELFFIKLLKNVYDTSDIEVVEDITTADILIENTQIIQSYRDHKQWVHTYLFSGESYIHPDYSKYSCVLYGKRNHENIVNTPLYLPYYVCSHNENYITTNIASTVTSVPPNDVLVIVSNPGGHIRNKFITELERYFKVTFAGNYKNNTGAPLSYYYNSKEFRDYVATFKFVLAMENSEEDTYITEKITHGLMAGSIPIYWGSKHVTDYFNSERFLEVRDEANFNEVLYTMKSMSDEEWLRRVNIPPFTEFGMSYTTHEVAKHIKNLLFSKTFPKFTALYMICNSEFEPERYNRLLQMCNTLGIKEYNYRFMCPTYKHTIVDETMQKYVKTNLIQSVRAAAMRKSEISLFLNFQSVWEHICMTYKDGTFLILEADAYVLPEIRNFNKCLNKLENKKWSGINISSDGGLKINFSPQDSYCNCVMPYRGYLSSEKKATLELNCVEDISCPEDRDVRFMRKYHTRCTDSQLWSYEGCCQMLAVLKANPVFDIPLDYYITRELESNLTIKYYWSDETYFDQASNRGLERSTIQNDMC